MFMKTIFISNVFFFFFNYFQIKDSLSYSAPTTHIPRNINLFSKVLPSGGIYFIARSNILSNKVLLNDTSKVDNQLESIKYIRKYSFKKCIKMGCIWKLN